MTKYPDLFAALALPFGTQEVKVRSQAGRQFHYITARTAMNRLDDVVGPENWWDEYVPGENSVLCRLTIRLPDGSTVTKADAGGFAGMTDQGDDDKSGYSDAFKRACVKFGLSRYLYRDGVPTFVQERTPDFGSDPSPAPAPAATQPPRERVAPRTGKALFVWCKDQEEKYEVGLLKYLNQWAKLQDFPGRMVDWDDDMVALAYAEGSRKLASVTQSKETETDKAPTTDDRTFVDYLGAAETASSVQGVTIISDTYRQMVADKTAPNDLSDNREKMRFVAEKYMHDRAYVQGIIKGLVKIYKADAA